DADIATTNEIVVPADRNGVVVNFGVKSSPRAALVGFVDAAGKPLRAGLEGHLDADGSAFVVGYDGQAYIRGLAAQNAVTIDLGEGFCRAEFQYVP
ncbi:UNVERIFIED_CONTAM: fimbrial biogenesis outer membrane usher protein, partial [Bacteroidetes bacterium 56_B9]